MASKEVDLENYDNTSTANMLLTPRKMKSGSRCRNCITLVFSSIGIIFLLLGYIICGAFVFSNIEGKYSTHKGNVKIRFQKALYDLLFLNYNLVIFILKWTTDMKIRYIFRHQSCILILVNERISGYSKFQPNRIIVLKCFNQKFQHWIVMKIAKKTLQVFMKVLAAI